MKEKQFFKKGLTLIETLLYLAVASSVFLAVSILLSTLILVKIKNHTIAIVEKQGSFLMQEMIRVVENSKKINYPDIGQTAFTLSLNSYDDSTNPIIFEYTGSSVLEILGNGSSSALTDNNIFITNFEVTNLSRVSAPGVVGIQFTIKYQGNSENSEYNYSQTFFSSATLRK